MNAPARKDEGNEFVFELGGIHFTYPDGVLGVEIDSLGIRRGLCTILLGANGSGKSTLLKMLDGLLFPSAGEIRAFGEPLTERALDRRDYQRSFRSRVGFVFQDADIQCFSPTVRDELAFGPLQLGLEPGEVDRRVRTALETLRIESLAERYPYRLSGGEKKRVAIASILTVDPEVYLLDEPAANLDPATEGILIDLLGRFLDEGKTLVIATQDLLLARHLGERAVVLGPDRRLAADDEIEPLLERTDLLQRTGLAHSHRHPHRRASAGFRHSHYTEEESP
jgi:cobalt/nickel transport system ATP-binding protein